MDKMAYLQQIASDDTRPHHGNSNKNFDFIKYLTPLNLAIGGAVLFVFIIVLILFNTKKTVDNRDQDLLIRSYYMAKMLNDPTLSNYSDQLKSSDLRAYSSSLKSVLNELMVSEKKSLTEEFGIEDIDSLNEETIATEEKEKNTTLNNSLETARLSAHLDRVFIREIVLQLTYLISYQSEIKERTQKPNAKTATETEINNLTNIKNSFENFNTKAL